MKKIHTIFVLFLFVAPLFSQEKEDIVEILKVFASDFESDVFFNNDTPFGRALYLEINPVLGSRRDRLDPAFLALNDITEDDLRGFDRPILINQQEQQIINETEANTHSESAPKFAIISIGNRDNGIHMLIANAAYQDFGYSYHGQYQFEKIDDEWEIVNKKINKTRQ